MPRPVEESRFRNILTQGIMWVILGATIGAAALVNQLKQRSLVVVLDAAQSFEGFSIRLPKGWIDIPDEGGALATLQSRDEDEILKVSAQRPSLTSLLHLGDGGSGGRPLVDISMGGQKVQLKLRRKPMEDGSWFSELSAARPLRDGRVLTITLIVDAAPSMRDQSAFDREIDLIKQVAGSVQLEDSSATKPQSE